MEKIQDIEEESRGNWGSRLDKIFIYFGVELLYTLQEDLIWISYGLGYKIKKNISHIMHFFFKPFGSFYLEASFYTLQTYTF